MRRFERNIKKMINKQFSNYIPTWIRCKIILGIQTSWSQFHNLIRPTGKVVQEL